LRSNFWRTHVKSFSDNLLAVKFLTLFGTGTLPDAVQRGGQAVRLSLVGKAETAFRMSLKHKKQEKHIMKVIVIGGVAAGPKAASKIIRNNPEAEVTIIEKGEFLSYAGCGLPYYISGVVKEQKELMATPVGTVRDSVFFQHVKNVKVLNHTEATAIDKIKKTVTVRFEDGTTDQLSYDKLVLAVGAIPVKPNLPGIELHNIFTLHGVEDAEGIKSLLEENKAKDAVIIGGGLIGVEMAEALSQRGCRVSIIEMQDQILPMFDSEMAALMEKYFEEKGIKILTGTKVLGFEGRDKVQRIMTDYDAVSTDMVIMSVGVKPNIALAKACGLEIGPTGAIQVNEKMQTSGLDIYAAGDCVEIKNLVTGKPGFIPLGSTANKHGRVVANNICGIKDSFPGVLGSTICKFFDFNIAKTGLSEKEAKDAGFDAVICLSPSPDRAHFMPDAKLLYLKLVADKKTRKLLGAQAAGPGNGDKRVDTAAAAISAGMTVDDVANLDLCYAPPYAPAMDNLIVAANILRNKLDGLMTGIKPEEAKAKVDAGEDCILLDVRSPKEVELMKIDPSINIPLGKLRSEINKLEKYKKREIIVFCKISLRGYEAALILKSEGYENVKVMDGGILMWPYTGRH
jgi:NADPH-dependent 2,4-dienoyl-CoA reductase/sulfur reductase-like enzyme/rhodanese-related sulfurtransferase